MPGATDARVQRCHDPSTTGPPMQGSIDAMIHRRRKSHYDVVMKASDSILFSGGAPGAEAEFGACAERHGVEEVNFTFDGHTIARSRGIRMLNHEELQAGDVSL